MGMSVLCPGLGMTLVYRAKTGKTDFTDCCLIDSSASDDNTGGLGEKAVGAGLESNIRATEM
jgi:hypothetical protein